MNFFTTNQGFDDFSTTFPQRNNKIFSTNQAHTGGNVGQLLTSPINQPPVLLNVDLNSSQTNMVVPLHHRTSNYMTDRAEARSGETAYNYVQKPTSHSLPERIPDMTICGSPPGVDYTSTKLSTPSFFMSEEVRKVFQEKNRFSMLKIDVEREPGFPIEVGNYHSVFPLESKQKHHVQTSETFGYATACYRAINKTDGLTYCLRRIDGFGEINENCTAQLHAWTKVQHANIVEFREIFLTNSFGEHSLVFVHDYFACAETLREKHFTNRRIKPKRIRGAPGQGADLIPENLLWVYVVQIVSALHCIHSFRLSYGILNISKIIVTDKSRVRLNCLGIINVLHHYTSHSTHPALLRQYQQEDIFALGKAILVLACNSIASADQENFARSVEFVRKNYSKDLTDLIEYIFNSQKRPTQVNDIMPIVGPKFYTHLDTVLLRGDTAEKELSKELQNGKLFRMICKLGVINEQTGTDMEVGDRYLLKLFRDYIFHQVTDTGKPWLDMSHIVQCLNKLDAGINEKICLMTRDEQNILVVSYNDLKKAFNKSYEEVTQKKQQQQINFIGRACVSLH